MQPNDPLNVEVKLIRKKMLLLPIYWFIGAVIFTISYQALFKSDPPRWCTWVLNIVCPVGWFILSRRFLAISCPRCGETALRRIPLLDRKVCCQWCNYPDIDEGAEGLAIIGDQWKVPPDTSLK